MDYVALALHPGSQAALGEERRQVQQHLAARYGKRPHAKTTSAHAPRCRHVGVRQGAFNTKSTRRRVAQCRPNIGHIYPAGL